MDISTLPKPERKGGTRELVAFQIAGQEFAMDIMAVREIRGWTPVTPLPHAPAYMTGLVNLRGTVLPIMDLAMRLSLPPVREPTSRHAIIVVQFGGRLVGLLVEGLSEIMTVDDTQIQPTPHIGAVKANRSIQGVVSLEGRMIGLLSLDDILPEQDLIPAEAA